MLKWLKALFVSSVSPGEQIARAAFQQSFPGEKVVGSVLRANESERFVVCILYGYCQPPEYKFYIVDKRTMTATILEDDRPYRPKNYR